MLSSGSDASLCLDNLAHEIGVTNMKPISYTTITTKCAELRHGHEVQLEIESLEAKEKQSSARQMATNEDIKRWPNLRDVCVPETGDKKSNNFGRTRSSTPD